AHDLKAVGDDGVIPAHAKAIAGLDPRPRADTNRRPIVAEIVFATPGNLAQLGVGERLEVAAFLVSDPAIGRLDGKRAARAPQDIHKGDLLNPQVVEPEGAFSRSPEPGIDVGCALVQAVKDDVDFFPVLSGFQASLVKCQSSSDLARPESQ